jgi:hypothetical protein
VPPPAQQLRAKHTRVDSVPAACLPAQLLAPGAWRTLHRMFSRHYTSEPLCSDELIPILAAIGGGATEHADVAELPLLHDRHLL